MSSVALNNHSLLRCICTIRTFSYRENWHLIRLPEALDGERVLGDSTNGEKFLRTSITPSPEVVFAVALAGELL